MKKDEMPLGFAMALSMNPDAMQKFATLGEAQKQEIIDRTHNIKSKEEMREYIDSLANEKR